MSEEHEGISENRVTFYRIQGHNHDGENSTLIDFSKYDLGDIIDLSQFRTEVLDTIENNTIRPKSAIIGIGDVAVVVDGARPEAVSGLTITSTAHATSPGNILITVSWNAPTGGNAISYTVQLYKSEFGISGSYVSIKSHDTTALSHTFEFVDNGAGDVGDIYYKVKVFALSPAGLRSLTAEGTVAPATDSSLPANITFKTGSTAFDEGVSAAFKGFFVHLNDNTDFDVKQGRGQYEYQVSTTDVAANFADNDKLQASGQANSTFFMVNNLEVRATAGGAKIDYYLRVRAIDTSNNSGAWVYYKNTTDGGSAGTGTTTSTDASAINVLDINGAKDIIAHTITATEIYAKTITAQEIDGGTITATELNALLSFEAGGNMQSADYASSSGTTGWKIFGGDYTGSGSAIFEDITARGTIYADSGEIGGADGWAINTNAIQSQATISAANTIVLSTDGGGTAFFRLGAKNTYSAANTGIWMDPANGMVIGSGGGNFSVNITGRMTATSANIAGWEVDADAIYTGTKLAVLDHTSESYVGFTTSGITLYSGGSLHAENFYISPTGSAYFKTGGTTSTAETGVPKLVISADAVANGGAGVIEHSWIQGFTGDAAEDYPGLLIFTEDGNNDGAVYLAAPRFTTSLKYAGFKAVHDSSGFGYVAMGVVDKDNTFITTVASATSVTNVLGYSGLTLAENQASGTGGTMPSSTNTLYREGSVLHWNGSPVGGSSNTYGTALTETSGTVNHDDYITGGTSGGVGKYIRSITVNAQGHVTAIDQEDESTIAETFYWVVAAGGTAGTTQIGPSTETLTFNGTGATSVTRGTNTIDIASTDTTYVSSDFTHDSLTGFVANEHIDWTADQGATNIHLNNLDLSTYMTYWKVQGDDGSPTDIGPSQELLIISGGVHLTSLRAANQITINHDSGAGSNHIPAGGSSGQFLKYTSSGTAVWAADNNDVYTGGNGISVSGANVITHADTSALTGLQSYTNRFVETLTVDAEGHLTAVTFGEAGGGGDHGGLTGLGDNDHPQYSLTSHNHSGVYATSGHNHSGVYATTGHTHSSVTGNLTLGGTYPYLYGNNLTVQATGNAYLRAGSGGNYGVTVWSGGETTIYNGTTTNFKALGGYNESLTLYPDVNVTRNLGSASKYWNYSYFKKLPTPPAAAGSGWYLWTNTGNEIMITASSERVKKNITTISTSDALTRINALRPVEFSAKKNHSELQIDDLWEYERFKGFIAEEAAVVDHDYGVYHWWKSDDPESEDYDKKLPAISEIQTEWTDEEVATYYDVDKATAHMFDVHAVLADSVGAIQQLSSQFDSSAVSTTGNAAIYMKAGTGNGLQVHVSGDVLTSSSTRTALTDNIVALDPTESLSKIMGLRPVSFTYKPEHIGDGDDSSVTTHKQYGLLAEEAYAVDPWLATFGWVDPDDVGKHTSQIGNTLDSDDAVPVDISVRAIIAQVVAATQSINQKSIDSLGLAQDAIDYCNDFDAKYLAKLPASQAETALINDLAARLEAAEAKIAALEA